MTTTIRRFYCELKLTAPYQTHSGSIGAGDVLFRGFPVADSATTAEESVLARFREKSPFADLDRNGQEAQLEVVLEELDLDVALSVRNMESLAESEDCLTSDWSARQALALLVSRMLGGDEENEGGDLGGWRYEGFDYLKGGPITVARRTLQTNVPDTNMRGNPCTTTVVATTYTIYWEKQQVAVVAELYRSDTKEQPAEFLLLNQGWALELVMEVLERRGKLPSEVDRRCPITLFNRSNLELHDGKLMVEKTPVRKANYNRTRAALAAFDAVDWEAAYLACETSEQVYAVQAEEDRLGYAVGRAFSLDSADRNSLACGRVVRPCPWLRKLLASEEG